jgi:energy-coupling factor transporter ATP-binding protein EcfA2
MREEQKKIAKCSVAGELASSAPSEKVLMVLGATGAGKSTLINGMINYAMGVKWEDNFRFKLIADEGSGKQSKSQTKWITAYTVHPMEGSRLPYKLTIIDTPGFGDSGGLERDKVIVEQIREFFSRPDGIQHLDGIGFVAQASLARLTHTQKYIFDSILSVFGNDIEKNIFLMLTFADGQKPPIMDSIEEAKIPYSRLFKFNNSALFAQKALSLDEEEESEDNNNGKFDQMFWQMGIQSLKTFFTKLENADSVSLQLTRNVLEERKKLEAIVNGLLPRIREAQLKLNKLLEEEAVLTKYKAQIEENKKFTWTARNQQQRKVDLPPKTYVTNCLTCNRTCHDICTIQQDKEKYLCAVMEGNQADAICQICNCHWTQHVNNSYRFEIYEEVVTKTYDDVKKRYEEGTRGSISVQGVITHLNEELKAVCESIFEMVQKAYRCRKRLEEIAIRPNPLTQEEYISLLIESEKRELKLGWEDRVRYLEEAKAFARTVARATNAASTTRNEDTKAWAQDLISKLRDEKIQEIDAAVASRSQEVKGDNQSNQRGIFSQLFGR